MIESVNHIRMTVYYTEGGGPQEPTVDMGGVYMQGVNVN
jgi:hypothetical protein